MSETSVMRIPEHQEVERQELSVEEVIRQVAKVQRLMGEVLKDGEHYGKIPGCGDKPTLLKAGAEKLAFTFRLAPRFFGEREAIDLGNGHREYVIRCELYSIPTQRLMGEGLGSCSTMETKYRFRSGPKVGTGRPVPKEYWNMRSSEPRKAQEIIGGKGFSVGKNEAGAWEITEQGEQAENPNIADVYNTVLKMAKKRAVVDATITALAVSDIFTQDLEEIVKDYGQEITQEPQAKSSPHREGVEHKDCPECTAAGVPKGYSCVISKGHFYIRNDKREPTHDFAHKSYVYCPSCKEQWGELSDEERNNLANNSAKEIQGMAAEPKPESRKLKKEELRVVLDLAVKRGLDDEKLLHFLFENFQIDGGAKNIPLDRMEEVCKKLIEKM